MKTNEEGFTFEIFKLTYTHFLNILRYYQTSNAKYLSIFELKVPEYVIVKPTLCC